MACHRPTDRPQTAYQPAIVRNNDYEPMVKATRVGDGQRQRREGLLTRHISIFSKFATLLLSALPQTTRLQFGDDPRGLETAPTAYRYRRLTRTNHALLACTRTGGAWRSNYLLESDDGWRAHTWIVPRHAFLFLLSPVIINFDVVVDRTQTVN
jgi:phage-related protein